MERQSIDYTKVGNRIKETRQNKGITREKLSEIIGISTMYLGQLERGERRGGINNFIEIANALDLSLDYLFFNEIHTNEIIDNNIMKEISIAIKSLSKSKKDLFMNIILDISKRINEY
ncbi:helix-turn-helix domain-containing protein [Oscillospiraceae bacterium OttesenSCG-928-G22]|nr:helix-turn-helix domain-containing protein [Oscillospiraceae bacterium OttesenSCG-928-G22]